MTRENVRNARETERGVVSRGQTAFSVWPHETKRGVLDALEIGNSSSGEVMFTIAEKFISFLE